MSLITTRQMFEKVCKEKELVLSGMYERMPQSNLIPGDILVVGVNYSTDRKEFKVSSVVEDSDTSFNRYKRIILEEVA